MTPPLVSVVIPTYNGQRYLVDAVQSVLDQSYPHLEIIVVDDRSPSGIAPFLSGIADSRLRVLVHTVNQGAVAARWTGVRAASGEIIAFLDDDDMFHPDKLKAHVEYLERRPDVGVTFNGRFEVDAGTGFIRSIWQPPDAVTLADLVLGFPFSPSDTVVRRRWALQDDIWDQSYVSRDGEIIFNGGEIVFGGRLAFAGASFGNVGRALTYRRYHPRRVFGGLSRRCRSERDCQALILDDPRCPEAVRGLRDEAFRNTYTIWSYYGFAQDETTLGQAFVREAVRLDPTLLDGRPSALVEFMVGQVAGDSSVDLEEEVARIFAQWPSELSAPAHELELAVANGYLAKGAQAVLFGRTAEGREWLARAAAQGATTSDRFIQQLTHHLLGSQREFGDQVVDQAIDTLQPLIDRIGLDAGRRVRASFAMNRALSQYKAGDYRSVPGRVGTAIANDPRFLFNRGALAILVRSLAGGGTRWSSASSVAVVDDPAALRIDGKRHLAQSPARHRPSHGTLRVGLHEEQ